MLKFKGSIVWKSYLEYNPEGRLHGEPYYLLTEEGNTEYLYQFNTETKRYELIRQEEKGCPIDLCEVGRRLEKEMEEKRCLFDERKRK